MRYARTEARQREEIHPADLTQEIMLLSRRWRALLNRRLKNVGQTDARLSALSEIAASADGLLQRELSERLGVEEPTVVRLVDALETLRYVERRPHAEDRRAKIVLATPAAAPALAQAHDIVEEMEAEIFRGVDAIELSVCLRVLEILSERLQRRWS